MLGEHALPIVEVFESIQGEGVWTGAPSTFIRLAGCNLDCSFCDTKYAQSIKQLQRWMIVEEILKEIRLEHGPRHVVVTGGEPTVQGLGLAKLIEALDAAHAYVTLETNGSIYIPQLSYHIALLSISPKLSNSGVALDRDMYVNSVKLWMHREYGGTVQTKFVIQKQEDLEEAKSFLEAVGEPSGFWVFQPDGNASHLETRVSRLIELTNWVCEDPVLGSNPRVRVLPQLHRIMYANKRGV